MSENKKQFDMNDMGDIASEWRNVDWDLIQRMRFMNADHEIAPDDNFSERLKGDD